MKNTIPRLMFLALLVSGLPAFAQPEVMAWGNLNGIRVDGQLLEFSTALCVAQPDWSQITRTGKERQTTAYSRSGKIETVKLQMLPRRENRELPMPTWSMDATQAVEDTGPGSARLEVEFTSRTAAEIAGAFLCIDLPASHYSSGTAQLIDPVAPAAATVSLAPRTAEQNEYVRATASGVRFLSPRRQLEVMFDEPTEIVIRDDRRGGSFDLQVFLTVIAGKAGEGQAAKKRFSLKATGDTDRSPVELAVQASRPGQMFDGLGGNFRIQNVRNDPPVIQHNLENLRVAWSRVEMPWSFWQPEEDVDPVAAARAGKIDARVQRAMEMARTLAQRKVPVIVSAWTAPSWAVLGAQRAGAQPAPGAPRGTPLNPEKMNRILESLSGYLTVLKEKYGVEAAMFSFNESDLGINVRQSPREHNELIKALGAHMAAKGLATTMLLGDTSDARPVDFIKTALRDPQAAKYIGAVSFHSWRGCSDDILVQWRDAARELNVPLLVGEGSTDAAAYRYPQVFLEQTFALYEIDLYTRILAIAQPKSILQWQLTADYSLLVGGGLFGDNGPLRPTRRFWNLKQLASTPAGVFALPVTCNKPGVTCAAFGDIANGLYALHVVNNGASRPATITGLPPEVKQLRTWVTDSGRGMQEGTPIPVVEGRASLTLDATSFTTLISGQ